MRRTTKGFSLVELMIVVAIIGILAAIAIPNFQKMQLKSKRAEVPGNVDGIKTSELAYEANFNDFVTLPAAPAGTPSKTPQTWDQDGTASGWESIGWEPDGPVRGNYSSTEVSATTIRIAGLCDVDADTTTASYSALYDAANGNNSFNATLRAGDEAVF